MQNKKNPSYEELLAKYKKEERNKEIVKNFWQSAIIDHDFETAKQYVGTYIQHDPNIDGSGLHLLQEGLENSPAYKGEVEAELTNYIADGNIVTAQKRKLSDDGSQKLFVQHIFRLTEDGKVEEHWSIRSVAILADSKNPLALY